MGPGQPKHRAPAASKTNNAGHGEGGASAGLAGRGGERGRARALCRQVGHGGARDAGRMSAAPIVDDLDVARDAEAAADRLLRDQAPDAEDMDGKAARSGRSMRWLGSAELHPSVCACCSPAGSNRHSVGWVRRRTEPAIGVGQILDPIEGEGGRVQGWPRGRRAPSWQGVPRGGAHGSPGPELAVGGWRCRGGAEAGAESDCRHSCS